MHGLVSKIMRQNAMGFRDRVFKMSGSNTTHLYLGNSVGGHDPKNINVFKCWPREQRSVTLDVYKYKNIRRIYSSVAQSSV